MEDVNVGMLFFDNNNRIADINPAAFWLLQLSPQVSLGSPIEQVLAHTPELMNLLKEQTENQTELYVGDETVSYIQIQITRLKEQPGRPAGTLLIIHDISEQTKIEDLQSDQQKQTFRDPLTGLYNRHYLEETLPRELSKSARAGKPLSLIMIDIDHLKKLNDDYGYQVGDLILQRLSHILTNSTRAGDLVARFGGDKFVVVFTDTPAIAALARAQEWRLLFSGSDILFEGRSIRVTFSASVVTNLDARLDTEGLIRKADEAIFQVKYSGRNAVRLSE